MISGPILKYLNGDRLVTSECYVTTLPNLSQFPLTLPSLLLPGLVPPAFTCLLLNPSDASAAAKPDLDVTQLNLE